MHRVTSVLVLALWAASPAGAKIYKWVLPDGTVVYSDRPQSEGAKELDLPPLQTYTPAPVPPPSAPAPAAPDAGTGYELLRVLAPKPDEVVRDNAGTVGVQLELKPALREGHSVEFLLDGKVVGAGTALSTSLGNVERGSHSVSAVVKDAAGKVVARAAGVTFHLKQASRLNRPRSGTGS